MPKIEINLLPIIGEYGYNSDEFTRDECSLLLTMKVVIQGIPNELKAEVFERCVEQYSKALQSVII